MRAAIWYRLRVWTSRHANKLWLVIVVAGVFGAMAGSRWEASNREQAICDWATHQQAIDRTLIDTVLADPAQGNPILDVASFAALPPEVQTYLRDIAATPSGDTDTLARRLERFRDEHLGADDLPAYC